MGGIALKLVLACLHLNNTLHSGNKLEMTWPFSQEPAYGNEAWPDINLWCWVLMAGINFQESDVKWIKHDDIKTLQEP